MEEDTFWKLIEQSRSESKDLDEQVEALYSLVYDLEPQDMLEFYRCFRECQRDAYRGDLWGVAYIINGGCSDDGFDYFIGWLIAQGRSHFESALANPERAAEGVNPGDIIECESILYVAVRAYEAKTGKTDFYDVAPNISRTLIGELFDEDKVYTLYPELAKRFLN